MIILANILSGLASALGMLISLLTILVGIRVLISWVNPDPSNMIVRVLVGSTEPFLAPIRRYLPTPRGLDLSPIVLFMALIFLNHALVQSLIDYAALLRREALQ